MDKQYDVIVIGAGNGGLSAAADAACAGLKTLVIERHNLPGGSASSFVRGRFEFETALHELFDLGNEKNPGTVWQLFDHYGIHLKWYYEQQMMHIIVPNRVSLTLPTGIDNFLDTMEKAVPGCRDSVARALACGKKGGEALTYINNQHPSQLTLLTKYGDFLKMCACSAREGFQAVGVPDKAAHLMETYWSYLGGTEDQMDFFTMIVMLYNYLTQRPAMPAHKSHEMSLALVDSLYRHGGNIWYSCEVSQLLMDGQQVTGVIANGHEIHSRFVIADVSPTTIITKLLPKGVSAPKQNIKLTNARKFAYSLETMYIGLNKSAEELGIRDYSTFIVNDLDPVKQAAATSHNQKGTFIANCLNCFVPDASPKGTCTLFFTAMGDPKYWANLKPEEYFRAKNQRMKDWVDHYERCTGIHIRPYIEEASFASDVTFARYLGTPNGSPYGYQIQRWDNIVPRLINMDKEQMFSHLEITGAAAENIDGYNCCYTNGFLHAQKVIKEAAQ